MAEQKIMVGSSCPSGMLVFVPGEELGREKKWKEEASKIFAFLSVTLPGPLFMALRDLFVQNEKERVGRYAEAVIRAELDS